MCQIPADRHLSAGLRGFRDESPVAFNYDEPVPGTGAFQDDVLLAQGQRFGDAACCYGDYCDRLRYYTATTPFLMNTDCKWTSNVSDEQGYNGLKFDAGYYPVGVRCYGDYCDSKSFKICKP